MDVELVPGGRGIFEVAMDGQVVIGKTIAGFPTEEQVVASIRAAQSASA